MTELPVPRRRENTMKMKIIPEAQRVRLVFSEDHPWNRDNFFTLTDTFASEILTEHKISGLPLVFDLSSLKYIDSLLVTVLVRTLRAVPREHVIVYTREKAITNILIQLGLDSLIILAGPGAVVTQG
jgi:hypothetical protein